MGFATIDGEYPSRFGRETFYTKVIEWFTPSRFARRSTSKAVACLRFQRN
jgi:hypothetical protein